MSAVPGLWKSTIRMLRAGWYWQTACPYACKDLGADIILDIATLTGAQVGPHCPSCFATRSELLCEGWRPGPMDPGECWHRA